MRASELVPEFLRPLARRIWLGLHRPGALAKVWTSKLGAGRRHGLPSQLIVSLTSYPARFGTLHLTLLSLLQQGVMPDKLLLWIAHDDMAKLPGEVRALERDGLIIRECDDLKSYKKLIPAVEVFPDAFIATADDDVYYPPQWLGEMVDQWQAHPSIACHRAHRLVRSPDGGIAPYLSWEVDVQDGQARQRSADVLPTGAGGVLYPPQSLDPRVTDRGLFQRLCPGGDDLWFYWCARMAGTPIRKVGGRMKIITWAGSQDESLWADNREGGNDRMIRALIDEFGIESLGL
jgi:hypothetical protein